MHPLSDKDLDRLSREAAEQFDVDQNTSGWEKLEHKLNHLMPAAGRRERRRFLFFIWLFALLSGGGLVWLLTGKNSSDLMKSTELTSNNTSKDLNNSEVIKAPSNKEHATLETLEKTIPGQEPENVNLNPGAQKLAHEGVESIPNPLTTINQPGDRKNKSGVNQKRTRTVMGIKRVGLVEKKDPTTFSNPSSFPVNTSDAGNEKYLVTGKEMGQPVTLSLNTQSMLFPGPENPTLLPPDFIFQSPPSQLAKDGHTAAKKSQSSGRLSFKNGLELGAVIAPDMSTVEFTHSDKVGFSFGLQIGYRLSQRWSLSTGVLYTKKNYTSHGKDFNPPKGSWLDNVTLDMVEGNCYMFDIPINIRYDLNQNNKQRLFVSTGLSSYIMKKEDYHYYYQYTNGSPGYRHRSSSSTERHWLGIVNISAGFEKNINQKFSVQAEPYLKIPLQGIGYGNMQLSSYGMYFSLKYKPGFFAK
ncbi:MAG: outer membrane beta-barrel protein [Flavitalea sp.]